MISKIINFEQLACGSNSDDNCNDNNSEKPRDYYDPNIMRAERAFKLEPQETVLIVIFGRGFRYNDDTIYMLSIKKSNTFMTDTITAVPEHGSQLCLVVKNCSSNLTVYVGQKTPLQWLLDMARLSSKLCFCAISELTDLRCELETEDIRKGLDEVDLGTPSCGAANSRGFMFAPDETVVLKKTF